jgi:hypothetical protein
MIDESIFNRKFEDEEDQEESVSVMRYRPVLGG